MIFGLILWALTLTIVLFVFLAAASLILHLFFYVASIVIPLWLLYELCRFLFG